MTTDGRSTIRDVSDELATIGLWGPRARDVLVAAGAPPTRSATPRSRCAGPRAIAVGPAPVLAARISYAGELGWELTMPAEWAVAVWDRAPRAPAPSIGLEPFGYRALDALRMEKGYRYFGTDLTMRDTPFEAGLGRVRPARQGAVHRARRARRARAAAAARRGGSRTIVIGGAGYVPVYGGEAVRARWRGHRPPAERRLRPDRRADDRLRLPAGRRSPRAPSSRSTSSTSASPATSSRPTSSSIRRASGCAAEGPAAQPPDGVDPAARSPARRAPARARAQRSSAQPVKS